MDEKQLLRVIAGITIAITVTWIGAVGIAPLIWHDFSPPIELTVGMTTFMTGLFGLYLRAKNPKGGGDE